MVPKQMREGDWPDIASWRTNPWWIEIFQALLIISIENKDHGGPTRSWLKIFN
jgi:hypothetical protein